jgi:hypothetical protein
MKYVKKYEPKPDLLREELAADLKDIKQIYERIDDSNYTNEDHKSAAGRHHEEYLKHKKSNKSKADYHTKMVEYHYSKI